MTDPRIEIIYRVLELIETDAYKQKHYKGEDKATVRFEGNCILDSISSIRESLDHLNYLINRGRF